MNKREIIPMRKFRVSFNWWGEHEAIVSAINSIEAVYLLLRILQVSVEEVD